MAKLTTARRNALPKSDFAVPAKDGYPVDTANRARDALSRVSQHGSSQEKAQVRRKVAQEYPGIKQTKGPQAKKATPANAGGNGNNRNGGGGRNGNGGTTQRLARELGRRLDARMTPRR
ncbi:MAG TPA: hypothetical protein VGF07_02030 [Stellaceae bacterium]|jgi:hypothetical protein